MGQSRHSCPKPHVGVLPQFPKTGHKFKPLAPTRSATGRDIRLVVIISTASFESRHTQSRNSHRYACAWGCPRPLARPKVSPVLAMDWPLKIPLGSRPNLRLTLVSGSLITALPRLPKAVSFARTAGEHMRTTVTVVAAFLFLGCNSAISRDLALSGAGGKTCAVFAKDYKDSPVIIEDYYFAWAQGFMTGFNTAQLAAKQRTRNLGGVSIDQQQARIRAFCNRKPLADYFEAVIDLYLSLPESAFLPSSN